MTIKSIVINRLILMVYLTLTAGPLVAQEAAPAPKPALPCQQAEHYRHFDFWIGNWDVYGKANKSGALFGTNTISSAQGTCLLVENWQGTKGSTGTSVNYYDGIKGLWVQHWVSADGTVINIEGGVVEGSMVLEGHIYYATTTTHPIRKFKGTWTPMEDGVVRQHFEESIDDGITWKAWFTGYYFPQ